MRVTNLDAGTVPAGGHELAVGPAVVVDVGRGPQPQLGTGGNNWTIVIKWGR